MDAVVQGNVKPSSIDRIQKASFDEKLSVINLLISKLTAAFTEVFDKDQYVRDLYEILKELKDGTTYDLTPRQVLALRF